MADDIDEAVGDGGDPYTGLDRFGRVIDVRWINASNADINRFKYGFDPAGNRLWRRNTVAPAGGFDEQYSYDGLDQVTDRKLGTLWGCAVAGNPVEEEQFGYDARGNWPSYTINENGVSTLNQSRTHQLANEITAISGAVTPVYDPNGNMTTMPKVDNWNTAQTLTWDAWNLPVTVSQNGATLGTYQYDGLNRRIWKQSNESGSTVQRQFYYSSQWQVLEERTGTSTTADRQYVWGVRYQDDLVLRDVISGTASRMYALADYFQPTAICDTTGTVQERYAYRAFGDVSYYSGSFAPISTSAYGWEYLFGSYYFDLESLLYQVRNRYYHTSLGRWLSRDPLPNSEISEGPNLYEYVKNNPVDLVDPLGLFSCQEICSELGRVQNGINGIVNTLKNGTAGTAVPTVSGSAGMGGSNPIETQFENNPVNIATGIGGYGVAAAGYIYINTLYYTGQTPKPATLPEMGLTAELIRSENFKSQLQNMAKAQGCNCSKCGK